MRLWHIDILPYLPKSQLLAQWRELNSIFKKQDKHILINYIYNYPKSYLKNYTIVVMHEMWERNYDTRTDGLYHKYFNHDKNDSTIGQENGFIIAQGYERFDEHNNEYLLICFMNLYEKYIRGQKDFDKTTFNKLYDFVNTKFDLKSLGIEKE